jgi:hypothetical protein
MADQASKKQAPKLTVEHLNSGSWNADINHLNFTIENPENLALNNMAQSNTVKLKGTNIDLRLKIERTEKDKDDNFGLFVFAVNYIVFVS